MGSRKNRHFYGQADRKGCPPPPYGQPDRFFTTFLGKHVQFLVKAVAKNGVHCDGSLNSDLMKQIHQNTMHIKLAVNKLRFFEFTFNKLGVKMIIMPSTVRSSSSCNCSKPSISIETVLENTCEQYITLETCRTVAISSSHI